MDLSKMQEMLSQAKQMQEQMQDRLGHTVVEASAGGGAVTVKMTGQKQVVSIKIAPAVVAGLSSDPSDLEMLEDLLKAAFNEAARKADEAAQSNVSGMLGGMGLPPGLL